MGLFGPWEPCPHCGNNVRKPILRRNYLCPRCRKPGPWAGPEQITDWQNQQAQAAEQTALERRRVEELQRAREDELAAAASLSPISVAGFVMQKREHAYFAMDAELAEWVKQRGQYKGGAGIRGISFGIPGLKGVRAFYGGFNQRTYVPGPEGWTLTDSGTAVITSKRIIFRGSTKAIEWQFSKLLGVALDPTNGCLLLQVSNRQKAHVLRLPDHEIFETALEASLGRFQQS